MSSKHRRNNLSTQCCGMARQRDILYELFGSKWIFGLENHVTGKKVSLRPYAKPILVKSVLLTAVVAQIVPPAPPVSPPILPG